MDRYLNKSKSSSPPTPSSSSKRPKLDEESKPNNNNNNNGLASYNPKDVCSFGKKCFRRNIHHFREYRHPHLEALVEEMTAESAAGSLKTFTTLPENFETTLDKSLVIDQVNILVKSGFKPSSLSSSSSQQSTSSSPPPTTSESKSKRKRQSKSPEIVHVDVEEEDEKQFSSSSTCKSKPKICTKSKTGQHHLSPAEKWRQSEPFNMFLIALGDEDTNFSMNFRDLFHESFGSVKSVCHINFMFQMQWLMDEIIAAGMWEKPTTFIYGTENPGVEQAAKEFDWVQAHRMKAPHAFGHHHTKMSLIEYEDLSIRFVIHTANLIEADWLNKTQGMWISPKCPRLDKNKSDSGETLGESKTGFRGDILSYFATYQLKLMEPWMKSISHSDCSEIKVVFVGSAPNTASSHHGTNGFKWGLKKVETVLRKYDTAPTNSQWPLIAQCSSIGSLGPDSSWLEGEWASLLQGNRKSKPPVKLVYPTVSDVKNSIDGMDGADCLPYANITHSKQKWIESHMCRWVSYLHNRTFYMPHVKSYCRVSPDNKSMAWFILSSANLSKAAWGKLNKKKDQLVVMSWEAGVLFLPKFLTEQNVFTGHEVSIDNGTAIEYPFPLPFDLPLSPYSGANKPWLCDYLGRPRR